GVGIVISKKLMAHFKTAESINSCIMVAYFGSDPILTIVSAYTPTEEAIQQEKDDFYKALTNIILSIPPHNILIVAGDLNARISAQSHQTLPRNIVRYMFHDKTNNNGERLVNLCETCNLHGTQQRFKHTKRRQWTWQHPQIDHILIRNKWVNSVRNCRAYSTVDVNPDHRILTFTIKLNLRSIKNHPNASYIWVKLTQNNDLLHKFSIEIANRFTPPLTANNDLSTQECYDRLASTLDEAAKSCLGKLEKKKPKPWLKEETLQLLTVRNKAKTKHAEDEMQLDNLNAELNEAYKSNKEEYYKNICRELNKCAHNQNMRGTYRIINQLAGNFRKNTTQLIKTKDGNVPTNKIELLSEWRDYFSNFLNSHIPIENVEIPEPETDLPINTGEITTQEIERTIKVLKNGKAAGIDKSRRPESLKFWGPEVITELKKIFNDLLEGQNPPWQWLNNLIIPVFKKGTITNMNNYRGITLMSVAAKVFNHVLLNRIYLHVDNILDPYQAGFQKNRSFTEQIHILRRTIKGANDQQLPLVIGFIDFYKVFDSAIRKIDIGLKSQVVIDNDRSQPFRVETGVLQGDVLAPLLFVVVLDYAFKQETPNSGFVINRGDKIRHLAFADIAQLSNTIDDIELQMKELIQKVRKVGLKVNTDKTKIMAIPPVCGECKLNSEPIEQVDNFKYLRSLIRTSAWSTFWKLNKILHSQDIDPKIKKNIYLTTCVPVFLYGSETWALTETVKKKINRFHTFCLHIIQGLRRTDRVRNEQILAAAKENVLSITVLRRQLTWLGHQLRK
uniref:Reverse transcriptase domain-containing protein n=1 Tax=Latimeria chalumnae TaxID=7897 RepID=H3AVD9_LATCH